MRLCQRFPGVGIEKVLLCPNRENFSARSLRNNNKRTRQCLCNDNVFKEYTTHVLNQMPNIKTSRRAGPKTLSSLVQ